MSSGEQERSPIFTNRVPDGAMFEYFDVLKKNKPLHIVITNGTDKPIAFLEEPEDDRAPAVCRVFFRYPDSINYIMMVADTMKVDTRVFKSWETNSEDLFSILHGLSQLKNREKDPGIRAVATFFKGKDMLDVDIFWTSESGNMV